jgi:hypothetical protein
MAAERMGGGTMTTMVARHSWRRTDETVRMPDTIACAAELTVHRPRAAALALFTPEGERAWAPGWDPTFPTPQRTEGPGAVFATAHGEDTTTWVMVDQDERLVRYARFTPGATAGIVTVTVLAPIKGGRACE